MSRRAALAVGASLALHAAAAAGLWLAVRPDAIPVAPPPDTRIEIVSQTVDRSEAQAVDPPVDAAPQVSPGAAAGVQADVPASSAAALSLAADRLPGRIPAGMTARAATVRGPAVGPPVDPVAHPGARVAAAPLAVAPAPPVDAPAEEVRSEDVLADDVRAEDVPADDVRAEDVRAEDVRAEDVPAETPVAADLAAADMASTPIPPTPPPAEARPAAPPRAVAAGALGATGTGVASLRLASPRASPDRRAPARLAPVAPDGAQAVAPTPRATDVPVSPAPAVVVSNEPAPRDRTGATAPGGIAAAVLVPAAAPLRDRLPRPRVVAATPPTWGLAAILPDATSGPRLAAKTAPGSTRPAAIPRGPEPVGRGAATFGMRVVQRAAPADVAQAARPATARIQPAALTATAATQPPASDVRVAPAEPTPELRSAVLPAQTAVPSRDAAATALHRRPTLPRAMAAARAPADGGPARPATPAPGRPAAASALPSVPGRAELAWSGGVAPADPVSLAAVAAFMRPAASGAQGGVRDQLARTMAAVPCARLQTEFRPETGVLALRGHVPVADAAGPVVDALRAQVGVGIPVVDATSVLPPPQCDAIAGMAATGLAQSTDQATDPRIVGADLEARTHRYTGGERMVLDLDSPDYPAVVYVDYFDAAGNVLHLQPNDIVPPRLVSPGTTLQVGASTNGQPALDLTVGPPYGREVVVAFAASRPIHDAMRPLVEPAAPYLAFLAARIAQARRDAPDFKGEWVYFFIETRPEF